MFRFTNQEAAVKIRRVSSKGLDFVWGLLRSPQPPPLPGGGGSVIAFLSRAREQALRFDSHCARGRAGVLVLVLIGMMSDLHLTANAASIPYPLSGFSLENINADGSIASLNGGLSALLTGGNNGSGLEGTTDFITTATMTSTILVHFIYASLDAPGFDAAGYLIGSSFSQFADADGQFGTATFSVVSGETFGFRVLTLDNTSEPGLLTISSFATGVPEPRNLFLMSTALILIEVRRRRRPCTQVYRRKS